MKNVRMTIWLVVAVLVLFVCVLTSQATTITYELTDLIGAYNVTGYPEHEEDRVQVLDLGIPFLALESWSVEYWGEIISFPLVTDDQGHTREHDITGGIHVRMLPDPESGYGIDWGVGLPDDVGEFYKKFTFTIGGTLNIPSSQARLAIGFYAAGYQSGEYFYQDGALNLNAVKLTLNGTTIPEPATFLLLGLGVPIISGLRKRR